MPSKDHLPSPKVADFFLASLVLGIPPWVGRQGGWWTTVDRCFSRAVGFCVLQRISSDEVAQHLTQLVLFLLPHPKGEGVEKFESNCRRNFFIIITFFKEQNLPFKNFEGN